MKKTNLILIAILAILGSISAWYFVFNNKDTSLEGYDFEFAVKDTANIGKILIADRQGGTAILTRISPSEWQVNGKYKTIRSPIENLLDVIARIELMYRLPRNAVKPVLENIATNSKLVQIFDKKGKMIRSYYVGGVDMDGRGTYVMMEGANSAANSVFAFLKIFQYSVSMILSLQLIHRLPSHQLQLIAMNWVSFPPMPRFLPLSKLMVIKKNKLMWVTK